MTIVVIGVGFVGLVTAAVFSKFGNTVWAVNRDKNKSENLKKGKLPFFEPNLEDLVGDNVRAGRLHFTTSYAKAIPKADVVMIAVGTPSAPDGRADLKYVLSAAESLATHLKDKAIIVIKSTVPPGTNDQVKEVIKKHSQKKFYVASVPEFLREGTAVEDTLHPDRVVIGANDLQVIKRLKELHRPLGGEIVVTRPESAQLTKYAANAYLANRIVFINQIADLSEKTGADVQEIIRGMGLDRRIGLHYWWPGLQYGGSCFPKDVKELSAYARSVGEGDGLFEKIDSLNDVRPIKLLKKLEGEINGWDGKTVAVLGLSFKPNTDDIRESPALRVIPVIANAGAIVRAYDPQAMESAKLRLKDSINFFTKNLYQAAQGAHVLMVLVEWDEFKSLDLTRLKKLMKKNPVIIDTRNLYDPDRVKEAGFKYIGIGR